jgi:hypothetical protein
MAACSILKWDGGPNPRPNFQQACCALFRTQQLRLRMPGGKPIASQGKTKDQNKFQKH